MTGLSQFLRCAAILPVVQPASRRCLITTIAHGVAPRPPFSAFPLLADKRTAFDRDAFTPAQRLSTVRQVATLLEGIYVHLRQKQAMCAPKVVRTGLKQVLALAVTSRPLLRREEG